MKREICRIAAIVIVVIALAGCSKKNQSQSIQFTLRGFVKTESNQPINGIQVTAEGWIMTGGGLRKIFDEILMTDYNGEVVFRDSYLSAVPDSMSVIITDVGSSGGSYQSVTISPEVVKTGESIGSWNAGTYECNFDVVLKSK